jgi:hypothetical protein
MTSAKIVIVYTEEIEFEFRTHYCETAMTQFSSFLGAHLGFGTEQEVATFR